MAYRSNVPAVTKNLLIVNVLVFVMCQLGRKTGSIDVLTKNFSLFYPAHPWFRWWQPVTYMFMHGGFAHLLFNMYTLYVFGPVVERIIGSRKFGIFYFACGLFAAATHIAFQAISPSLQFAPTVGASGAIYGILLGYGMLYPNNILQLIFPPVALKAKWFVVIFAVIELVTGLLATSDGIAHFAHLGGMVFGLILILIWKKDNRLYN